MPKFIGKITRDDASDFKLVDGQDVDIRNATTLTSVTLHADDTFLIDDAGETHGEASTGKITASQIKTFTDQTLPTNYITNDADDEMLGNLTITKTSGPQLTLGYDANEKLTINVADSGVTTIATTDNGGTTNADLTFDIDGDIVFDSASNVINYMQPVYFTKCIVSDMIQINHDDDVDYSINKTAKGFNLDFDSTGDYGSGITVSNLGMDIAIDSSTGSHHATAVNKNYGIATTLTGNQTTASTYQYGFHSTITGGDLDKQHGLFLNIQDGSQDLKIVSSAENDDYFSISTTANGATTIATVDESSSNANLTFSIDGAATINSSDFSVDSSRGIYLDAANGEARLNDDAGPFTPSHAADITTKAYVDAAILPGAIQTVEVTLDESDMNDLHNTPITILAAQGASNVIMPISVFLFIDRDSSTAQSASTADLFISYHGGTSADTVLYYVRRWMYAASGDRIKLMTNGYTYSGTSLTAGDNMEVSVRVDAAITSGSIDSMKIVMAYWVYDNS